MGRANIERVPFLRFKAFKHMKHSNALYVTLLTSLLVAAPNGAKADDAVFSYNTGNGSTLSTGTKKVESYDVAMLLSGDNFKGKTLKAITIPFTGHDGMSNLRVWLSSKLELVKNESGKKVNNPDIMTANVDFSSDTVTYTLPEPYTIGDTLYVGYSFNVDNVNNSSAKEPICLTNESYDGYYIYTSKTYLKWKKVSNKGSLTAELLLGNVDPAAAVVTSSDEIVYGGKNNPTQTDVTLQSLGAEGVQSIDFDYEVGTVKGTGHADLADAIPNIYAAKRSATIELPAMSEKGTYPVKVTISKVNGKANGKSSDYAQTLKVYSRDTNHRTVFEEYTGTWCGYCPRGFAALEIMNRLYPDKFIGVSYHNTDPMCVTDTVDRYPSDVASVGYPSAFLDRQYYIDPYYGFGSTKFEADAAWLSVTKQLAPVGISVKAAFNSDAHTIKATATTFCVDPERSAGCKVEYLLVADSLHGSGSTELNNGGTSTWTQSNYLAEDANVQKNYPEPEFEKFYYSSSIEGLYFSDVMVYSTYFTNESQPLPVTLEEDQDYETTFTFDTDKVLNFVGSPIIQDKTKLNVVALVVAADGTVLNATKSHVEIPDEMLAAIKGINNVSAATGSEAIYSINGMRTDKLQPGVNIVKTADGKTIKVMK